MSKYKATIGMEVHVELKTKSKMFCDSKNDSELAKEPNVNICPVCTGQPGMLPVPNRQAIEFVQMAGLALNCELNLNSKFDRKNYFYPDIPKCYQISQYDQPLCGKGYLDIFTTHNSQLITKKIGITRIHLEEDTGKLVHVGPSASSGQSATLIDFNRAGVPLMELVTEPDIESGAEARIFCQKLQQICRYLGISDADMEKGQMRCEVNISLYKKGEDRLSGTKVEVKNINSFKFVEKAIDYEIERQTEALEKREKISQETRGFDSTKSVTVSQRKKESAHDYRYFPEPDIPPLKFTQDYIEDLKRKLPELPAQKIRRFEEEYKLPSADVEVLVLEKDLAEYFEEVASEIKEKIQAKEILAVEEKVLKLAANYVISELRKHLIEKREEIKNIKITPENYAELVGIVADGKINSSAAQTILKEMYQTGGDPSQIIETKGLAQMSDEGELEKAVAEVLEKNEKSVADYKAGKQNALQFLMGQVMSATKGKANPQIVIKLLKSRLD